MLSIPASIRILLSRDAVDFRKSHDGLLAIVRDTFGDDPFDGALFVFVNKRRDRVKLLQWDRDGFWLHYKRLESGTFRLKITGDGVRVVMSRAQLSMLLEGIDLEKRQIRKPFERGSRMEGQRGAGNRRATAT